MVQVERLAIPGPLLLRPVRHADERGYLAETYQAERFRRLAGVPPTAQENLVFSRLAGTVRGLHAQSPPHAQAKLVSVLAGAILDVAVDIRRGSPTYGRHVAVRLSAEDGAMLLVPHGFLHGYCTERDEVLVQYKLDSVYVPGAEVAVRFDDPTLGIDWGRPAPDLIASAKDQSAPDFASFDSPFRFKNGR